MKIGWVQDLDPFVYGGGAQLTDRTMLLEGIRRGHDIEVVIPQAPVSLGRPLIISNATGFPERFFQEALQKNIPCVWFNHDYTPICKYRLFFPLDPNCYQCHLKERWQPILEKARLMVWLSPLHREAWLELYPELASLPHCLAPSPVDAGMFPNLNQPRSGVLAVHSLMAFKGRRNVIRWAENNTDTHLTVVGDNPEPEEPLPANVTVIPDVPYSRMNEVYNQHEAFLHLPDSPMPFDRVVPEAYFSGCRIIGNGLIGALSWPFFQEGREAVEAALRDSPRVFWDAVEQALV